MGRFLNALKKAGRWIKNKVIKPTGRFLKNTGLKIADGITSVASYIPGTIGKVAGLANKGIKAVRNVVDNLPSGKVKDKLQQGLNKTETVVDKGKRIGDKIVNASNTVNDATKNTVGALKEVVANVRNKNVGGAVAAGGKVVQAVKPVVSGVKNAGSEDNLKKGMKRIAKFIFYLYFKV